MPAHSDVVFSQSPANHAASRISDWSDAKQKADDFTLATGPRVITKINWWGSYGANPDPAVDSYVFKFFAEDPTMPGFPFYECLADGTRYPSTRTAADFSRTPTSLVSNPSGAHDGGPVYAYSAVLDKPIVFEGNKRFWLAVTNSTPTYVYPPTTNSRWGWLESSGGSQFYRAGHCEMCNDDWSVSYTNNLAFSLEAMPLVAGFKATADGTSVDGLDAYVTAAFRDFFYVRVEDRTSAIRVRLVGQGLAAGDRVEIAGHMATNADGERYIEATSADKANGSSATKPIYIAIRSLGGTALGLQQGTRTGVGLNNMGTLVRISGVVRAADPAAPAVWFTISDGSGTVKVIADPGTTIPSAGRFVAITGVSSCEKTGDNLVSVLRVPEGERPIAFN